VWRWDESKCLKCFYRQGLGGDADGAGCLLQLFLGEHLTHLEEGRSAFRPHRKANSRLQTSCARICSRRLRIEDWVGHLEKEKVKSTKSLVTVVSSKQNECGHTNHGSERMNVPVSRDGERGVRAAHGGSHCLPPICSIRQRMTPSSLFSNKVCRENGTDVAPDQRDIDGLCSIHVNAIKRTIFGQ